MFTECLQSVARCSWIIREESLCTVGRQQWELGRWVWFGEMKSWSWPGEKLEHKPRNFCSVLLTLRPVVTLSITCESLTMCAHVHTRILACMPLHTCEGWRTRESVVSYREIPADQLIRLEPRHWSQKKRLALSYFFPLLLESNRISFFSCLVYFSAQLWF